MFLLSPAQENKGKHMLWFNHSKPVARSKSVAALAQREAVRPASLNVDSAEIGLPAQDGPALHFSVRYALPEYLSFMWQHGHYLIHRRRIGRIAGWCMLAASTSVAALHFVMQGRSQRIYEFSIDGHGIMRSSPTGVSLIAWREVRAIRSYSRGYMVLLRQGSLPIPFRCLPPGQAKAIGAYCAALRVAAR